MEQMKHIKIAYKASELIKDIDSQIKTLKMHRAAHESDRLNAIDTYNRNPIKAGEYELHRDREHLYAPKGFDRVIIVDRAFFNSRHEFECSFLNSEAFSTRLHVCWGEYLKEINEVKNG